jgi:hypothetical protein
MSGPILAIACCMGAQKQSTAMYAGASVGLLVWLLLRNTIPTPGGFVSVVDAAWAAVGIYGLIRGEITIASRGGRSPKTYCGPWARVAGAGILLCCFTFVYLMLGVDR